MPLLDALLEKRIRLIDYECITEGGERGGKVRFLLLVVPFGRNVGARIIVIPPARAMIHFLGFRSVWWRLVGTLDLLAQLTFAVGWASAC